MVILSKIKADIPILKVSSRGECILNVTARLACPAEQPRVLDIGILTRVDFKLRACAAASVMKMVSAQVSKRDLTSIDVPYALIMRTRAEASNTALSAPEFNKHQPIVFELPMFICLF